MVSERRKVVEISIDDKDIREFLLLSVKSFIEENRRKKIIGRAHPLKVIIKNLFVPKFETNINDNFLKVVSIIDNLHKKNRLTERLSDIEREIVAHAEQIDTQVAALYGLDKKQEQKIQEISAVSFISEYFDRTEEYVGLEDIEVETPA